ncbi:MAG: beta-lactamase family protein [Treponema sp.]|nr:beta-lactamase family protein [Treponema sp.]
MSGFTQVIEKQNLRCEGVVVLRHGEKIAEYRWIPEVPRNCHSVSKSFTAIAAGMAIERGKLSLRDRVIDTFADIVRQPEGRLASLNLEHLLTMTRGFAKFSRPATVAAALEQTLSFDPGGRFVYDNGSTFLASAMFTRVMGQTVGDYLTTALFRPLGIPDPEWAQSADGHTAGATGLFLSTSNLALFGQLLLQRGCWQGAELVPPLWIDCAGRPHVSTKDSKWPDYDIGYGYGFWPCRHGAYRADGKDGQFIIVLPRQDAVVAINSNEPKHYPILYAVWDKILPFL